MFSFLAKCVLLFFVTSTAFSQAELREQGLLTLEPVWRQALGGEVLSLPHVQAQSAVVALDGGNIRAYSTAGTPLWNFPARGRISPYVTRSKEGTSYFARINGTLIAVNRSGRELWRRNIGSPLSARIVIGWDGRLFVPAGNNILCYTASGTLLWTRSLEAPFTIAPALDRAGGIIFAINNEIRRIDAFGNTHVWTLSGTPVQLSSVELAGTGKHILVLYQDGTMELLGAQNEVPVSMPRLPSRPLAVASNDACNVAIVLNDGRVTLFSVEERRFLWTADSHLRNRHDNDVEIVFDNRGIFVLSRTGATGLSHEGARLWFTYLHNAATIPAFGEDCILYLGGRDWILYAFRIDDPQQERVFFGPAAQGSYNLGRPQSKFTPNVPFFEDEIRAKLEQIGAAINAGNVGVNEPAWTTFLLNLSASQENIVFRIAALDLLGRIGSKDTIPWLLNVSNRVELEPAVRAAAITAIGHIGVDPGGIAIRTFFNLVTSNRVNDTQMLHAITSAVGAICRFSGPPLSETGIRILTHIAAGNHHPSIRRQANRELASLR